MTQNFDPKSKCRPQWYFSAQKSCQAFLKDKSSEGGGSNSCPTCPKFLVRGMHCLLYSSLQVSSPKSVGAEKIILQQPFRSIRGCD